MAMFTTPFTITTTRTTMRMADTLPADALLTLVQMLSPSYPVGAFAYSHGLEWAVQNGDVTGQDSLADWLHGVLRHGAGQADALFLDLLQSFLDEVTFERGQAGERLS